MTDTGGEMSNSAPPPHPMTTPDQDPVVSAMTGVEISPDLDIDVGPDASIKVYNYHLAPTDARRVLRAAIEAAERGVSKTDDYSAGAIYLALLRAADMETSDGNG